MVGGFLPLQDLQLWQFEGQSLMSLGRRPLEYWSEYNWMQKSRTFLVGI